MEVDEVCENFVDNVDDWAKLVFLVALSLGGICTGVEVDDVSEEVVNDIGD